MSDPDYDEFRYKLDMSRGGIPARRERLPGGKKNNRVTGNGITPVNGDCQPVFSDLRGVRDCSWISGTPCDLGASAGSICFSFATRPVGTFLIAGGCEGFSTTAIGQSVQIAGQSWNCQFRREETIGNSNSLSAQANCCTETN